MDLWASELEKDPNLLFRACKGAEVIKAQLMSLGQEIGSDQISKEPVKLSVPFAQRQEAKELGAYFHQEEKLWVSSPENKNLAELTSRWPYDPEKHQKKENQEQKAPKRAYLDVPFEEKERAKELGAKFDFRKKQWFVEPMTMMASPARKRKRKQPVAAESVPARNFENGNAHAGQQNPPNQQPWVFDFGPLDVERPGPVAEAGKEERYVSSDADSEPASERTEGSGQPASQKTDGRGPDRSRNTDPERGGDDAPVGDSRERRNYAITPDDHLGSGGAKVKFRDNITAIKTLQRLRESGASHASAEDRKVLVRYVGWGGLQQVFKPDNSTWKAEYDELRQLLPVDEYAQARRSTQDAHFTSADTIAGIYQGLDRLGLRGDGSTRILEPSAGIGNFLGLMPEKLRESDHMVLAVELDPITAAIGEYLYPEATYINKGFQEINLSENSFDLAIGNPPFGNQKIFDPSRPDLDFSIHNYFLSKSIDSLRDGGVAAFVVSRYFLDAVNNPARDYIAGKANLLGAIRLPNNAFKENALTEVTTDILFFQKSNELDLDPAWLKTGLIADPDGNEITLNQYYLDHPEQMAGRMVLAHNMHREAADLLPNEDFVGIKEEIEKRLECLPLDVYQARTDLDQAPATSGPDLNLAICEPLQVNALFLTAEGCIGRRRQDIVDLKQGVIPQYELYEPKNQKAKERIAGLIELRDCLTELMASEQVEGINESLLNMRRATLNRVYDAYVKKYGYINSLANKQAFSDDPAYHLLCSLERDYDPGLSAAAAQKAGKEAKPPSAKPADIFTKRVLGPRKVVTTVETAKEALIVSMNEYGHPDLDYMSGLCGKPVDDLSAELDSLIYRNPQTLQWELADHYLTGDVKGKLKEAQEAARRNGEFRKNVEALQAVQPPDLEPVDIAVHLGSTWVPSEVVADFCRHLLGPESVEGIGYHPALGEWATSFNNQEIDQTVKASTWGTGRYYADELITAVLNHTPIQVRDRKGTDTQGRPIYVVNEDETIAANQKAEEIKQAFQDWIWLAQERRENLAQLYNDAFNTHVPRKYDGSHLELPGSSLAIDLRKHQKDAIWRGIQDGTALLDHTVGAGYVQQLIM